nr:hypothetical protein Iba_chr03eCG9440 [Ipomoea batatas]
MESRMVHRTLAPGFRFGPTDEELASVYYSPRKVCQGLKQRSRDRAVNHRSLSLWMKKDSGIALVSGSTRSEKGQRMETVFGSTFVEKSGEDEPIRQWSLKQIALRSRLADDTSDGDDHFLGQTFPPDGALVLDEQLVLGTLEDTAAR